MGVGEVADARSRVGDAGAISYYIADRTLRQTHAPPQLLARVDASVRTLGYGATLIGALVTRPAKSSVVPNASTIGQAVGAGISIVVRMSSLTARSRRRRGRPRPR